MNREADFQPPAVQDSAAPRGPAICAHCGAKATCYGRYEGHGPVAFACDTCCGHGNEDGWCKPAEDVQEAK